MKQPSATWIAVALLLCLALVDSSSPDNNPEQAAKAADSSADTQYYASAEPTGNRHGHYKHQSDNGYENDDEETYPATKKYKSHDKPEYYRGYGHMGGEGYPHKPKHNDYYPKPPKCPFCPKNLTQCDTQCLDLNNGVPFCGTCDNVCPEKASCITGTCKCDGTLQECPVGGGFVCVDKKSDPNFCGDCFTACNATLPNCQNGTCVANPPPCGPGESQCYPSATQSACVNLKNDTNNCGACGRTCNFLTGNTCTEGKCCLPNKASCLADFQCCGFDPLSLLPIPGGIVLPTAKCDGPNILQQKCCKSVNTGCGTDSECCNGLECRNLGTGNKCQKIGCISPSEVNKCNQPGAECCAGFKCSKVSLFFVCSPIPLP